MATEHFIPFFAGNKNIFFFGLKIMNNMKKNTCRSRVRFFFLLLENRKRIKCAVSIVYNIFATPEKEAKG